MTPPPTRRYLSFKTKILLPGLLVMALLVISTVWVLSYRITGQLQNEAAGALHSSRKIAVNFNQVRARDLLLRCRSIPSDPRFKAVAALHEPNTMRVLLADLLEEMEIAFLLYEDLPGGWQVISHRQDGRGEALAIDTTALDLQRVLAGEPRTEVVAVAGRLYDLAATPVTVSGAVEGCLAMGEEIDENLALELSRQAGCDVAFLAGDKVVASSLASHHLRNQVTACVVPRVERSGWADAEVWRASLEGNHVLGLLSPLADRKAGAGLVLLSSYEKQLRNLKTTQQVLIAIGFVVIVLSSFIGWLLIGRATRPLYDLRAGAEAVGRGELDHQVKVTGHDEFGDLADAFNHMTANLKSSRERLEKTVETLQETRARLLQSEKLSAVGEFISGVAHELNNPLTVMVGYSQLMSESGLDTENRQSIRQIADAAERCHGIVQNLLSFARQRPPERKPVLIHDLLDGTINFLQYEMRTSNIEVQRNYDSQVPPVVADPHQLQQVFLNLINNARQAIEESRRSGRIRVSTAMGGDRIRVSIEDDGPGIPPQVMEKIFDPFFTTKQPGKGTGLGLSVSYGIIKEHQGEIHVHSKPGQGATFVVELPSALILRRSEAQEKEVGETLEPARVSGSCALVVDDEDGILRLCARILSSAGYEVDTARNGREALEQTARHAHDLILCDWKMPGINGQEFFERLLKTSPETARRVLFMTGDVLNEQIQQFAEKHGVACLAKPFSLDGLRAALETQRAAGRAA